MKKAKKCRKIDKRDLHTTLGRVFMQEKRNERLEAREGEVKRLPPPSSLIAWLP